jgi:hypothetical protein
VEPVDQLADHLGGFLVVGRLVELLGTDRTAGQKQQAQETDYGHSAA